MTYRPYPGSFASHVIDFFIANADEELTPSDMLIKWPIVNKKNIRTLLSSAVEERALIRSHSEDGGFTYRAGPNIKKRFMTDLPLASYVTAAAIHPKDPPHVVIEKLQLAINAAKAKGAH